MMMVDITCSTFAGTCNQSHFIIFNTVLHDQYIIGKQTSLEPEQEVKLYIMYIQDTVIEPRPASATSLI